LLFWIGDEGKEAFGPSAEIEFHRMNQFNLLKVEKFLQLFSIGLKSDRKNFLDTHLQFIYIQLGKYIV